MKRLTQTNLFALFSAIREHGLPISKVDSVDVPHLKKCIEFGLLAQPPSSKAWMLTPEGISAMAEFAKTQRNWPRGTEFHPTFVAMMEGFGLSGPGYTAPGVNVELEHEHLAQVIPFPVRRNGSFRPNGSRG